MMHLLNVMAEECPLLLLIIVVFGGMVVFGKKG
jgi:hypothetical protein